ncbi:MAG: RIP metalloprotease RseP [Aestuariivita sp.]|nr:RIP metalloprotease RseP [Aestuariivita sp.]MCY4201147.1 RIP metalloprotease RseP [Aestuariivita sp.]MCY4287812.1 RIP metalloprotease RseP [Aestuariivita sp.]MCY4345978.1 RIP metalloprotease RseP [Aestuariivita sp.]
MEVVQLIPSLGNLVLTIAAFIVVLLVIVAIHEFGHYIVGYWSGIHAEVFSIGFGPTLFSRVDRKGTTWRLAAVPLGGFVQFAGDIDAASSPDSEAIAQMSPAERRRTLPGAPLWARTATIVAGPMFNFVTAIILFAAITVFQGEARDPLTVGSLRDLPEGSYQLLSGDQIVAINGIDMPASGGLGSFGLIIDGLPTAQTLDYSIIRNGERRVVAGPQLFPPLISSVVPRSAAADAGLRPDDVIMSVDRNPIFSFEQLRNAVIGSGGESLDLEVWRDDQVLSLAIAPRKTEEIEEDGSFQSYWRIGLAPALAFEPATQLISPIIALWDATLLTGRVISDSLVGLYAILTGVISSCNLSGVIGIAEASGSMASQGFMSFLWFIAFLSVAIGLVNLFPIPVLDGGHLLFISYEAIVGRPPNAMVSRVLMGIGLTLIVGLMIFAIGNDIFCP